VTGAHQGIGEAVALAFTRLGGSVVGFDIQFTKPRSEFLAVPMDLSDEASVVRATEEALRHHPRVDVLVNAAGILRMGSVESMSAAAWHETLAVNVSGPLWMMKAAIPLMKQERKGAIVNVGSNAAHVPRLEMVAYAAAKAALVSLSHNAALELAPYGIRCNLVSPGSTDTPMQRGMWRGPEDEAKVIAGSLEQFRLGIPLGKLARPADIANLVVFLASDLAGHITMQDIVVDGGATLGA
jgi:2,3-dihydro-2,3-dihydroxybenzoate dehydrogenase